MNLGKYQLNIYYMGTYGSRDAVSNRSVVFPQYSCQLKLQLQVTTYT